MPGRWGSAPDQTALPDGLGKRSRSSPWPGLERDDDRFVLVRLKNGAGLMGKAARSPVTGDVVFTDTTLYPDYLFVDMLKGRTQLPSTWGDLKQDPFLLKPIPLLARTWVYHWSINAGLTEMNSDPDQTIRQVLLSRSVDVPVGVGLASPLMLYVPGALGSCLTTNVMLVVVTLLLLGVMLFIAVQTNTPKFYKHARLYSLPLRLGYLTFVLLSLNFAGVLEVVGYCAVVAAVLVDLVTGDFLAVWNTGMTCSYKILHPVGSSRVYVCQRDGAHFLEDVTGHRGLISERVSGVGAWEREHHLIADVGDLLVELRPMTPVDWDQVKSRSLTKDMRVPFINLAAVDEEEDEEPPPINLVRMRPSRDEELTLEDL